VGYPLPQATKVPVRGVLCKAIVPLTKEKGKAIRGKGVAGAGFIPVSGELREGRVAIQDNPFFKERKKGKEGEGGEGEKVNRTVFRFAYQLVEVSIYGWKGGGFSGEEKKCKNV